MIETETMSGTAQITDQTKDTTTEENLGEKDGGNPNLIRWEEWALSAEEHLHALQKWRANPKGRPLGHR